MPIRYYSNEFQVIQTAHRPETFRSILSRSLKDNLDPLNRRRLLAEHQVEMFYNFHLTPWMRLTGDFQIIRPTRPIATTAIVPGMRLVFIFLDAIRESHFHSANYGVSRLVGALFGGKNKAVTSHRTPNLSTTRFGTERSECL